MGKDVHFDGVEMTVVSESISHSLIPFKFVLNVSFSFVRCTLSLGDRFNGVLVLLKDLIVFKNFYLSNFSLSVLEEYVTVFIESCKVRSHIT